MLLLQITTFLTTFLAIVKQNSHIISVYVQWIGKIDFLLVIASRNF